MQSRWIDREAKEFAEASPSGAEVGRRVYSSRLIGADPDLVLHGGGNTSVKLTDGSGEQWLYVKGSGWDLATIEAPGLPAVRMAPLLESRQVAEMPDTEMVALLRASLRDPAAPTPSVEALLHAFLPARFVDHSHASAVLALANQREMRAAVQRIYGGRLAFVPYVMPGFDLSIEGDRVFRANPDCEGLWLENHGLFTFGDTAREAYERMIAFTTLAERELADAGHTFSAPQLNDRGPDAALLTRIEAALTRNSSPFKDAIHINFRSSPELRAYAGNPAIDEIVRRGTATPDHVIRIKPFPLLIEPDATEADIAIALADYRERYTSYFERNAGRATEKKVMLDPYPRVIIIQSAGVIGLGRTAKESTIAGDLMEQTSRIVNAAETYGRFTPIKEADLFDMEYWSLEQAKLNVRENI